MPREFVIVSPEPITAIECVTAATAVDPNLGVGRLWEGGGIQIAGESPVLAVLRSVTIETGAEAAVALGTPLSSDAAWWTEAYGPFDNDITDDLVRRLASHTGGTLAEIGESQ